MKDNEPFYVLIIVFLLILLIATNIELGLETTPIKTLLERVDNEETEIVTIIWQDKQYATFRYRGNCDLLTDKVELTVSQCK